MPETQNVPTWLTRALDPTTPTTENNETVRTENNYFDDIGAEIIYPTIRMGEDGSLYKPEDPMQMAIDNSDYIFVEGPPNQETANMATQVSKQISDQINAARTTEEATDMNKGGLMSAEDKRQNLEAQLESGLMSPDEFDIRSDQLALEESFELPEGDVRSDFFPVISRKEEVTDYNPSGKFIDIGTPGIIKDFVTNLGNIVTSVRLGEDADPEQVSQLAMDVGTGGLGGAALTKAGADLAGYTTGMFVPARKVAPELAQKADDMRMVGKTDKKVFSETGIHKGAEGIDKLEIPDGNAKIKKQYSGTAKGIQNNIKAFQVPVEEVLDHPVLYKAYPEIKDVKITFNADDPIFKTNVEGGGRVVGMYKPDLKEIVVNPLPMPSAQQKKEFILHELQHAVQEREGFALGSNPRKEATRLQNTLTSLLKQKDKARERNDYEAVKELDLKIDQVRMISPKESYRRQAGEVESRLVEQRSGLKPSRNKNYFPGNQEEYGVNLDPNRGLAEDLPRKKQAVVTKRGLTDYTYSIDRESVKLANGGLMLQTEAGENMKKENPVEEKQDINQDGKYEAWEQVRQEAIKMAQKFETPEMNMGGLMQDGVGVIIGIEEESGNEIPAGSMPEEVADDVSAMLSEGEYVVPADVVRWHGVKMFEELRCEAKMGMGLMAEDGRIAEAGEDEEYEQMHKKHMEDSDVPSEDVEVEEAEHEVVYAAEGVDVVPEEPEPANYILSSRYNPTTNRLEYYYRDFETGSEISQEEFESSRATSSTARDLVGREVYGEDLGAIPDCGEGFVYDEATNACVPESIVPDVTTKTTRENGDGDGGDGDDVTEERTAANNYGFSVGQYTGKDGNPSAGKFQPGVPDPVNLPGQYALLNEPFNKISEAAYGVNQAQAVSAARQALGLSGLTFSEMYGGGMRGEYNDGKIADDVEINGGRYAVSFQGDVFKGGDYQYDPNDTRKTGQFDYLEDDGPSFETSMASVSLGQEGRRSYQVDEDAVSRNTDSGGYKRRNDNPIGLASNPANGTDNKPGQVEDPGPYGTDEVEDPGFDASTKEDSGFSSSFSKGGYITKKNTPKATMIKY